MVRFLTRLFAARTAAPTRPARRTVLSLEALETREAPSSISQMLQKIPKVINQHFEVAHHAMNHNNQPAGPLTTAKILHL